MTTTPVETTPAAAEPVTAPEAQTTPPAVTVDELKAQLAKVEAALKDANKEAAARRKKLDEYEKAEQARKDSELSETDRLKKELTAAQQRLIEADRIEMQRQAADAVGLPAAFVSRIVGADLEAMTTDARVLKEAMPPADPKKAPPIGAANPGGGAPPAETLEQKRRRLGLR